jgi:hypothetical protein
MLGVTKLVTALVAVVSLVQAHPGETQEEHQAEILARSDYIANLENQSLFHCQKKLNKRDGASLSGLETIARRRMEKVRELRKELNLEEDGKRIKTSSESHDSKA